jgi:DNA-binding transcriptional LysR family regulator
VTCAEGIAYLVLTPLLEKFHARYPGLKVDVILTDRILDLAKGEADVAVRAAQLEDSTLIGRKISDLAWGFYSTRGYAERHGGMSGTEDIGRHSLIAFDGELADMQVAKWLRAVAPGARIAARSSGVTGALLTAKSGIGTAMLPSHIGDSDSDLVRLLGPLKEPLTACYLLAHPDLHKTPRVRAFFDFMIEEIEQFRPMLTGRGR